MAAMTPAQIDAEVMSSIGKGIMAAAVFLAARIKEKLSVAAPRKRVLAKSGARAGTYYYRATTPATPGAPPRKLSGRLRSSITYVVETDGLSARVGTNVVYARAHEFGDHKFLEPVINEQLDNVVKILGEKLQ